METDIYLIDRGIQKKNILFGSLSEEEREKRILTLMNHGFVWNPYYEEFENLFLSMKVSVSIINLNSYQMSEQIKLITKNPKSFENVKRRIQGDSYGLLEKLDLWAFSYSIIYGLLIWIIGIPLMIFSDLLLVSSFSLIIGTLLMYYWITYHILYLKIASRAEQVPLMKDYPRLFRILRILTIAVTSYLILTYNSTPDNYLLIGFAVVLAFFTNYFISKSLVHEWWRFRGILLLEKYYGKF